MIAAIREQLPTIPLGFLCRHFGSSRSSFYYWQHKGQTVHFVKKSEVCEAIRKSFEASKQTYGSPRICDDLRDLGIAVSENTVAKYMREMGLDARLKKRFRAQTTDSNHSGPIADRLVKVGDENTLPTAPAEMLAGDITYLKLPGGRFLYLAVVIDLFTREVVGWSMKESLHTDIILAALTDAMARTSPDAEVIFHSDRGSQYASDAYRSFCKEKNVLPSMSRRGNCYDNVYVESWFGSLKKEWIYRHDYRNEKELRALVFEYIEVWYNKRRKRSALGYLSPEKFRNVQQVAQ